MSGHGMTSSGDSFRAMPRKMFTDSDYSVFIIYIICQKSIFSNKFRIIGICSLPDNRIFRVRIYIKYRCKIHIQTIEF